MSDKMTDKKEPASKLADVNPYAIEVELPSKGMFYGEALVGGKVTLRPVTVQEEKLLAGKGDKMEMAYKVLQKCICSECPPLDSLLMTDTFFLLLNLRAISYGAEYGFQIQCPGCDTKFKHSITLPEGLQLKVAEQGDVEPFDIELPLSKQTVSLRFLRGSDEKEIDSFLLNMPNAGNQEGDASYIFRLSRFIAKINGEEVDAVNKMDFCSKLIGKDSLAIREAIAEHETGPILSVHAKCPSCQLEVRTVLPLTSEFFPASVA